MNAITATPDGSSSARLLVTAENVAEVTKNLTFATRQALKLAARLKHGALTVTLPDGRILLFQGAEPGPLAEIVVHDFGFASRLSDGGDLGFAEAYLRREWDTPDLTKFLELFAVNYPVVQTLLAGKPMVRLWQMFQHFRRRNTKSQARRNIHAHYDLGNEFYRLWLDEGMTYSSALFEADLTRSLADAQSAKYARILKALEARPGQHILEVGCGWGGFAEQAARAGCRVTGITISQAQLEYAQRRIAAAGLEALVELRLQDYRDVEGQFDHVVSIEMFEAVGASYWPGYFAMLRDRLRPGGRAVVQSITIADAKFERYRTGTDFIQQYIFPGGMLPSPERLREVAQTQGLTVAQMYGFGPDYAETLRCWHHRFLAVAPLVQAQGFDERFMRTWRFYLAYCEAGFRARATDVVQALLVHA